MDATDKLIQTMRDLVVGNRILAREGVVDAYGHITVRHPNDPERYLMSRSRSPELVTLDDIMEFRLDGTPIDDRGRAPYAERFIHGAIYETRPDVKSVVHNHSLPLIPFGVTGVPIRPVLHVAGCIGAHVPVWDIRPKFGDGTNLLVVNMAQGRDLATALGRNRVVLMRGHGCAVTGRSIKESVLVSNYLQVNATLQLQALQLGKEINYLTPGEADACAATLVSELSVTRAWEYFRSRAVGDSI
jgi:ribulose-5-phosphate 4-epimerase/fuculose-1-phosphate aldolase